MTKQEVKNSIVAQLNQSAIDKLVDELAGKAVEVEALKQRVAELEKPTVAPAAPASSEPAAV